MADLVLIVTGGTGVIGGAVASVFAREARGVVIFGRSAGDAGVQEKFAGAQNVLAVPGDITSPEDVQRLCDSTLARFGKIDGLINCAGIVPVGSFTEMPWQDWLAGIQINLVGYALASRAVLPYMMRTGFGRIVNITTRLAGNPRPGMSAYSCSKGGAHILTRSTAIEIAKLGLNNILINDLIPGPTGKDRQDPLVVVPFIRDLVLLPPGGPTGKTFFRGQLNDLFAKG